MRRFTLLILPILLAVVFVFAPYPQKAGVSSLPKGDQPLIGCDYVGFGKKTSIHLRGFPLINQDSLDDHGACLNNAQYYHSDKVAEDALLGLLVGCVLISIITRVNKKR